MVDVYSLLFPKCYSSCYCCPHKPDKEHCPHTCTSYILGRLILMFEDPLSKQLITRQQLLINHYLSLANGVLKILDLPHITCVLEFLSQNLERETLYTQPLHLIFDLLQKRPVLKTSSESIDCTNTLADYFTALGNCLIYLKNEEEMISKVISSYLNLLSDTKSAKGQVKVEQCGEALLKSKFLFRLTEALYVVNKDTHVTFLDVIFTTLNVVPECGPQLVFLNIMEGLLQNLSLLYEDENGRRHPFITTAAILLRLYNSVTPESFKSLPPPSKKALTNLRRWLQYETLNYDLTHSNNVLVILCRIIFLYDDLEVASCGIIQDIFLLSFGSPELLKQSWAKSISYMDINSSPSEHEFMHFLLATSCLLLKYKQARHVGKDLKIVQSVNDLLSMDKKCWNQSQSWELGFLALQMAPSVAECLPDEFVNENVLNRIIKFIENLANLKNNHCVSLRGITCLYSLVLNKSISKSFENSSCVSTVLSLIEQYASMPAWSTKVQIILQYLMNILNELVAIGSNHNNLCSGRTTKLFIQLLNRVINPNENDSKMDPCMNLCLADLIWKFQVPIDKYRDEFVKEGGVYLCIDALESTIYQGQIIFLGLINDLLEDYNCVAQVATWRSKKNNKMFIELMCQLWRDCEKKKKIERNKYGTIVDVENPLESERQGVLREYRLDTCPPILEMVGCMRPKIFCILSLLLKHHSDIVSLIEEAFNVPFRQISLYDKITMQLIEYYECLKEGEIWCNMLVSLHKSGFCPLPGEEQVLHLLMMKHYQWANHVKQQQLKLESQIFNRECEEEKQMYKKIKSAKLAGALEALREVEKELLVGDQVIREEAKKQQLDKINQGTELEWRDQVFRETYPKEVKVTTLTAGRRAITPICQKQAECPPDDKYISEYKPRKVVQVKKLLD